MCTNVLHITLHYTLHITLHYTFLTALLHYCFRHYIITLFFPHYIITLLGGKGIVPWPNTFGGWGQVGGSHMGGRGLGGTMHFVK